MFEFELEKGSKKFVCPSCSQKTFVFYVSNRTGKNLSFDVGRCDRESACGYHRTPKEYFADNPQFADARAFVGTRQNADIKTYVQSDENGSQAKRQAGTLPKKPDYIPNNVLLQTLTGFERNAFMQFLFNLFPEDAEAVRQTVKDYLIGTTKDGKTIFWQIDQSRKVRTGKMIAYDARSGKRRKDISPNWTHAELKRARLLKPDFNLMQCFFGEHLLRFDLQKPVAIVEAEKTAVIASICFPEFVWLAIGSKQSLKAGRLKRLGQSRKFILYPDADGFALWTDAASQARFQGLNVKVSNLIERRGTDTEKVKGFDLADYLISQQTAINQTNNFIDSYNSKLTHVLNDESLMQDFETILDEQKAVAIGGGGLSEPEAERFFTKAENVRNIVLSL